MRFRALGPLAATLLMPATAPGDSDYRLAVDWERVDEGHALREGTTDSAAGLTSHSSPWIEAGIPFNEALISWNIDLPEGAGFAVAMRFRQDGATEPSAWYHFGRFGGHPPVEHPVTEDAGGKVAVDCFTSKEVFRAYQYRFRLASKASGAPDEAALRRVAVLVSNTRGDRALYEKQPRGAKARATPENAPVRIDVPFRSQRVEDARIASRICSPTSLAMVLAFRGIDRPTAEVASRAYDVDHDIYGNWPANIQAAYSYGLRGKLARFRTWEDARARIEAGQPIIISIRDRKGVLQNAPYKTTDGHLLVLCGFDAKGNPVVNDPAAADATRGVTTYDREQMERVWLDQGGLGYLIEPAVTAK